MLTLLLSHLVNHPLHPRLDSSQSAPSITSARGTHPGRQHKTSKPRQQLNTWPSVSQYRFHTRFHPCKKRIHKIPLGHDIGQVYQLERESHSSVGALILANPNYSHHNPTHTQRGCATLWTLVHGHMWGIHGI